MGLEGFSLFVSSDTYIYICMYVTCVYIYIHMYIHIYIHICIVLYFVCSLFPVLGGRGVVRDFATKVLGRFVVWALKFRDLELVGGRGFVRVRCPVEALLCGLRNILRNFEIGNL